jgi:hypothetical protein
MDAPQLSGTVRAVRAGFPSPSGRLEFFTERMAEAGLDPWRATRRRTRRPQQGRRSPRATRSP